MLLKKGQYLAYDSNSTAYCENCSNNCLQCGSTTNCTICA